MMRSRWLLWSCLCITACGGASDDEKATALSDGGADAEAPDSDALPDAGDTFDAGASLDASDSGEVDGAVGTVDPEYEAWLLEGPAKPVNLSFEVDTARALDVVVGIDGGTFTVTAKDGTLFELSIPANAVFNDTPIRMAPVTAIDGLPTELSDAHAVHLQPEGLTFFEVVALRVVTPKTLPLIEAVPFGFHENGKGMFLTYLGETTDAPTVLLDHFSGYGVARGSILDSPAFVRSLGERAEDRFRSREAWERMRARRMLPADPTVFAPPSQRSPFFDFYLERVIEGRLAMGVSACKGAQDTLRVMTELLNDRYLAGLSETLYRGEELELVHEYVVDVAKRCLMEEHALCLSSTHEFHRLLPLWSALRRQAVLYGLEDSAALDQLDTYAEGLAESCLQFKLEFESDAELTEPGGGGYHVVVESVTEVHTAPENFSSGKRMLQGQGDLATTLFVFTLEGCSTTSDAGPDVSFEVDDLIFHTTPYVMFQERGALEAISLRYFPGATAQSYTSVCDMSSFTSPPEPLWTAAYVETHMFELGDQSTSLFETVDWTLAPTNPVAEKYWTTTASDGALQEAGHFTLTHQP